MFTCQCTRTRSCKISNYEHLGSTRRYIQLVAGHNIPANRPASHNLTPSTRGFNKRNEIDPFETLLPDTDLE